MEGFANSKYGPLWRDSVLQNISRCDAPPTSQYLFKKKKTQVHIY